MMKPYQKYKDSGVQWIGKIPAHWEVCRLAWLLEHITTGLNPRKNFKFLEDGKYYYVTIANFKDGKLYLDDKCDRIDETAWNTIQKRSDLQVGDILFASISKDGQAYIVKDFPSNWNINESVFKLRFLRDKINPSYAYFILTNNAYYEDLRKGATGSTFQSIKQNKLKLSSFPVPSLEEQETIATYLEAKTSKLDECVRLLELQKADLTDYRKAIITKTVNRGLNPNAKLNDSGVDWIGQIPENWKVQRIKGCLTQDGEGIKMGPFGSSLTGKVQLSMPYKVYGQWNVVGGDFCAGTNTISEETYQELIRYKVEPNELLISMMGTIGKCAIIPDGIQDGIMDSHIVKVRLNNDVLNSKFFLYVYDKDHSNIVYNQIQAQKRGSIMDGLNSTIIKNLYIPLPPLSEQQAIADYLDAKTAKIDEAIKRIDEQIADLRAYRTALISDVVTGKIDVRN